MEMEGDELLLSLQKQMEVEMWVLEKRSNGDGDMYEEPAKPATNDILMRGISAKEWKRAEANRSLGYDGHSEQTQQRHRNEARKGVQLNEKSKNL